MLQTVASLIDGAGVVIYDHNMFITQATVCGMGREVSIK
jgi:hypothetical protein